MSTRGIRDQLETLYGVTNSPTLVSEVTDAVVDGERGVLHLDANLDIGQKAAKLGYNPCRSRWHYV